MSNENNNDPVEVIDYFEGGTLQVETTRVSTPIGAQTRHYYKAEKRQGNPFPRPALQTWASVGEKDGEILVVQDRSMHPGMTFDLAVTTAALAAQAGKAVPVNAVMFTADEFHAIATRLGYIQPEKVN